MEGFIFSSVFRSLFLNLDPKFGLTTRDQANLSLTCKKLMSYFSHQERSLMATGMTLRRIRIKHKRVERKLEKRREKLLPKRPKGKDWEHHTQFCKQSPLCARCGFFHKNVNDCPLTRCDCVVCGRFGTLAFLQKRFHPHFECFLCKVWKPRSDGVEFHWMSCNWCMPERCKQCASLIDPVMDFQLGLVKNYPVAIHKTYHVEDFAPGDLFEFRIPEE